MDDDRGTTLQGELHVSGDFPTASYDEWLRMVEETALEGAPFEKRLVTRTHEGIPVRPLYTRADAGEAADPSGFPGFAPFVRGTDPLGASRAGWRVVPEVAGSSIDDARKAITTDIGLGAGGFWIRIGEEGLPVETADDLDRLLGEADLEALELHLDAGPAAIATAAALSDVSSRRRVPLTALAGSIALDPHALLLSRGALPVSADRAWQQVAALSAWAAEEAPGIRTAIASGVPVHRAGGTAVHELACALGSAVETLRHLVDSGLEPETAASRILFVFEIGRDHFMEVAKLRGARLLWARALEAIGCARAARSMRIHAATSRRTKTVRDPWVNLLRATVECAAAAFGGAHSITTLPFDVRLGVPDELGRRIALNTQLILEDESHLHGAVDPAGGSWYVESLTRELARKAWDELRAIEGADGLLAAIRNGRIRDLVAPAAEAKRRAIATRRDPVTGVSGYPHLAEKPVSRKAPAAGAALVGTTGSTVDLGDLRRQASANGLSPRGLVAAAAEAVRAGASLGEVTAALAEGSTSEAAEPLVFWHEADVWERLRAASDRALEETGARPRIFLANMGPIPQHKARAGFSTNLFAAGGIEPLENDGFATPEEAAEGFAASGARAAVICSTDETYPEIVPDLAPRLRDKGATVVVLAGRPPAEHREAWASAGVDAYVHLGCDAAGILEDLLERLGAKP